MSDGFNMRYLGADDTSDTLRQMTTTVENAINELDQKIQAIKDDFIGNTANEYDTAVKRWEMHVADMKTLLSQAETTLNTIRNNYAHTDNREAMNWSAIQ